VVILAAIGGIWIPTFMMSKTMNIISKLSPLNWGLDAYYGIFLRNAGVSDSLIYIIPLLLFALACILASWLFNRFKSAD
jgi:ABC-2 type transport system permease protein